MKTRQGKSIIKVMNLLSFDSFSIRPDFYVTSQTDNKLKRLSLEEDTFYRTRLVDVTKCKVELKNEKILEYVVPSAL